MRRNFFTGRGQGGFSHGALLVCVVVLSLGVHFLLMLALRDHSFAGVRALLKLPSRDHLGPMRVERYQADPARESRRPESVELGPLTSEQLVSQSGELGRPPSSVLSSPSLPKTDLAPLAMASVERGVENEPRQDIVRVTERVVDEAEALLPRREIPDVERIRNAPDIVGAVVLPAEPQAFKLPESKLPADPIAAVPAGKELTDEALFAQLQPRMAGERWGFSGSEKRATVKGDGSQTKSDDDPFAGMLAASERDLLEHIREAVDGLKEKAVYKSLDDVLDTSVSVYRQGGDVWFRLAVRPRSNHALEVIAKDVLFLADVSGSLGEGRMKYCRQALREALQGLNPGDRFNVVAFRDAISTCSPDWRPATQDNVSRAVDFVSAFRSQGNTDLLSSLEKVFKHPRDPNRPLLAILLTDGKPTAGMTAASSIITRFSALNDGLVTVCTYGVSTRANRFLLDLLAHANRGRYAVVESGWLNSTDHSKIATGFSSFYSALRNPIMGDVTATFSARTTSVEAYPQNAENLYLGTPLEIYGRCPAGSEKTFCQLRGLARGVGYDMIVEIDLNKAAKGEESIRQEWAKRALYAAAVDYVRTKSPAAKSRMESISRGYDIPIPYADELK